MIDDDIVMKDFSIDPCHRVSVHSDGEARSTLLSYGSTAGELFQGAFVQNRDWAAAA